MQYTSLISNLLKLHGSLNLSSSAQRKVNNIIWLEGRIHELQSLKPIMIKAGLPHFLDIRIYERHKQLTEITTHYRILHLSTHAEMWNKEFEQASIAFYPQKTSSDNYLLASELSTAEIAPELMVLSACETGKGNFVRGEGMLSLSRIFAQSGAKNIIASLWKINNESNSEIMRNFYEKLTNDDELSISGALTSSKKDYLTKHKDDNYSSHPYFWSGMIHMGNDDLNLVTEFEGAFNFWWLILIIPGIILILFRMRSFFQRG